MIIWGGETAGHEISLNDGARYDPVSNTWKTVTSAGAPLPREFHTAVLDGREMIIWEDSRTLNK